MSMRFWVWGWDKDTMSEMWVKWECSRWVRVLSKMSDKWVNRVINYGFLDKRMRWGNNEWQLSKMNVLDEFVGMRSQWIADKYHEWVSEMKQWVIIGEKWTHE